MRVLVVSSMAWDNTNSIGNTFTNWFNNDVWKNDTFYNLYLRNQKPNNSVCNHYFQTTFFEMVNPFKKKNEIGKYFFYKNDNYINKNNVEKKAIGILHKLPLNIIYHYIDYTYRKKRWLNEKLISWLREVDANIIFICVTDVSFIKGFVDYIKYNSKAKIVLYIADDIYSQFNSKSRYRRNKLLKELNFIIDNSDRVLCASLSLKNYYTKLFNKNCETIYKGCKIQKNINRKIGNPLEIVYAGNFLYGRGKLLLELMEIIEDINDEEEKYHLKIYCNDNISNKDANKYTVERVSTFYGNVDYHKICEIQRQSDFVLIVESFDEKNKLYTKHSFSTKIPDSLQSGCNILAIGPKDISTINFLLSCKFTYVVTSKDFIRQKLDEIYCNKKLLIINRELSTEYAYENFEYNRNCYRIRQVLLDTLKN